MSSSITDAVNAITQLLVDDLKKRGLSAAKKSEERGPRCCLQQFPRVESSFCTILHERPRIINFKVIEALSQSNASNKVTSKQLLARRFKAIETVLSLVHGCNCPNTFIPILVEELSKLFQAILQNANTLKDISYASLNYQATTIRQKLLDAIGTHHAIWSKFLGESTSSMDAKNGSLEKLTIAIDNCNATKIIHELRDQEYQNIYLASKTQKQLFRSLDAEIQRLFLNSVKTVDVADNQNELILNDLQDTFGHCWAQDEIYVDFTPFGSRISRLGGEDSDLDISMSLFKMHPHTHEREYVPVFNDNRQNSRSRFEKSSKMLSSKILSIIRRHCGGHSKFSCLEFIPKARVPIVKLRHNPTKVEVDICIENQLGVQNTLLLREYTRVDPRIHALLLAVKYWSKNRCLNQSSQGTISSFSWCLMVIYYLHNALSPAIAPAFRLTEYGAELLRHIEDTQSHGTEHCSETIFELLPLPPSPPVPLAQRVTTAELLFGFFTFYGLNCPESFDFIKEKINIRLNGRSASSTSEGLVIHEEDDNSDDEEDANDEEDHEENSEDEDNAGLEVSMISEKEDKTLNEQGISSSNRKRRGESTEWRIKICDPFVNIDLGRCVRSIETQFFIQDELRRAFDLIVAHVQSNGSNSPLFATIAERNPTLKNGFCICNYCNEIGHSKSTCPGAIERKESKRARKQVPGNPSKAAAELKSPAEASGQKQKNSLPEKTKPATPAKSPLVAGSPPPSAKSAMKQTKVIRLQEDKLTGVSSNLPANPPQSILVAPPVPPSDVSGVNTQTRNDKKRGKKQQPVANMTVPPVAAENGPAPNNPSSAKNNSPEKNNADKNNKKEKRKANNKKEETPNFTVGQQPKPVPGAVAELLLQPSQIVPEHKTQQAQQHAAIIANVAALAASVSTTKGKGKKKSALSKTIVVDSTFPQRSSHVNDLSTVTPQPTANNNLPNTQQNNHHNTGNQIENIHEQLNKLTQSFTALNVNPPHAPHAPSAVVPNPPPAQGRKQRSRGKDNNNNNQQAPGKKNFDKAVGNLATSSEIANSSEATAPAKLTRKERRLLNRAEGERMIVNSAEGCLNGNL